MDVLTAIGWGLAVVAGLFNIRQKRGDVWRDEAEAYRAKAERLEQELADLRDRVERIEIENRRLAELASGREAVAELAEKIDGNHAEILSALKRG